MNELTMDNDKRQLQMGKKCTRLQIRDQYIFCFFFLKFSKLEGHLLYMTLLILYARENQFLPFCILRALIPQIMLLLSYASFYII